MKLSIITPMYNVEKYLAECLDSLVSQTLDDYEIILVNDGSTDSTLEIAEGYAEKYGNIRIISIDNGGQGRARNFALEEAKGDYIGFADSDDSVSPDMFRRLYEYACQKEADIAVCDYYRIESDGRRFYENARLQKHPLSCAGAVWNKIFRKELVEGIRFPSGVWYEDLEFSAKALMNSEKTVFLKEPLYYYRSGHTSTMRNVNAEKNKDIITVLEHIRKSAGGSDEDFRFLVINHILLDSIKRVSAQGGKSSRRVARELREYVKKYVPDLVDCESFRNEERNRKIIMFLNYYGLDGIANAVLAVKSRLTSP